MTQDPSASNINMAPMNSEGLPFELAALESALRYQRWVYSLVKNHLGKRTLEIGSGIGNMSRWLPAGEILCLSENDPALIDRLTQRVAQHHPAAQELHILSLNIESDNFQSLLQYNFDTIISFNVFEHLEHDRIAVKKILDLLAASKAKGPKRLIAFVPAHEWAFGSLDTVFGHFRRYSTGRFRELFRGMPIQQETLMIRHFNFVGVFGWLVQGRLLKVTRISSSTVGLFELLVPFFRVIDWFVYDILRLRIGQSVLVVATLKE